jgi:hypothetical protein
MIEKAIVGKKVENSAQGFQGVSEVAHWIRPHGTHPLDVVDPEVAHGNIPTGAIHNAVRGKE